jgi:lysozyme family protein
MDQTTTMFKSLIQYIFDYEGVYSNHEEDSGGETKWGVTKSLYESLGKDVPFDVATRDDMEDAYREVFWLDIYEELDPALALHILDATVNHGQGKGTRMFQKAVGATPDGLFGPKTLQAAIECDAPSAIIKLLDMREDRMRKQHGGGSLINGLMNRLFKVQSDSLALYYTGAEF